MRNRDTIAEIGVGYLFSLKHAINITRFNVATVNQELTSQADGLLLIRSPGLDSDQAFIDCDHNRLHWMQEGKIVRYFKQYHLSSGNFLPGSHYNVICPLSSFPGRFLLEQALCPCSQA